MSALAAAGLRVLERSDSMPQVALRVQQAASEAQPLLPVLEDEAALCAELVVLAAEQSGEPASGLGLRAALEALGPLGVRDAVWLLCAANEVASSSDAARADLWQHALRCACVCAELASGEEASSASLAGLLHDMGVILLYDAGPAGYREAIRRCGSPLVGLSVLETYLLGYAHTDLSAAAAERWALDDAVVTAVSEHHGPSPEGLAALLCAVDFADAALAMGATERSVVQQAARLHGDLNTAAIGDALRRGRRQAAWYLRLPEQAAALRVPGASLGT